MFFKLSDQVQDSATLRSRRFLYTTICIFVFVLLLSANISRFRLSSEVNVKGSDWKQRVQHGGNALIKIPKIIIQTLKDKNLNDKFFRQSNHSIATLHPDYLHMVLGDHEQREWVRKTYPLIYPLYVNFTHDIHRSDFVRFLLIYHYGGYYFDSDVVLMQKIDTWYSYDDTDQKNISVLVGIELHNTKGGRMEWRPRMVTSWAFGAEPRHPLFDYMIKLILSKRVARFGPVIPTINGESGHKTSSYLEEVVEFASPAVFTDAIASYLLMKGVSFDAMHEADGDKIADGIYLASLRAFACGTMWSESINLCNLPAFICLKQILTK
jgi:hypothetical protein